MATGSSRVNKRFNKPFKTKLDGVSPGCTRALINTTCRSEINYIKIYSPEMCDSVIEISIWKIYVPN
jgi:hypothetical protein